MTKILYTNNIGMSFGGLKALDDVSIHIGKGEILGLIGANGSGKSTLFSVISGFLNPTKGSVFLKDKNITNLQPHRIARLGLRRTFQIVRPFESLTVLDNVVVGCIGKKAALQESKEYAEEIIQMTGLWEKKDILCTQLPLLDRKRLEIARALAGRPEVLLLDETLSGLRESELKTALDLIYQIREQGVAILIVEHMMRTLMSLADRVVVLSRGNIIADGEPQEVAKNDLVIESYLGKKYAKN